MDPKNRELVTNLIMAGSKSLAEGQYVAITPGEVHVTDSSHVIVVQNIEGTSVVSELK
jgi:hypothetical protein